MAARIGAVLAAIAMVATAIVVRDRLDDGGSGDGADLRLVCAMELRRACEALARSEGLHLAVEPAGVTAARLSGPLPADPPLDGWLVPAPWPEMVRDARQRSGMEPLLRPGPVLARSPLVLAVWPDRADVLRSRCPPRNEWRCLGDLAGRPWAAVGGQPVWGVVRPGHAAAHQDSVGLAVLGAAAAGFFGRTDLTRLDVQENDEFRAWLTRLERAVPTFDPSAETPLEDMVLKGPAAFDAVGTTEAEAGPLLARAARPDKPRLIYPSPVATADLALATLPSTRAGRLSRHLEGDAGRSALADAGWRLPGRRPAAGVPVDPPLPTQSGMPPSGVLDALREVFREVVGA